MSQFYKYFRENMQALGMDAPESLYGSAISVLGVVKSLEAAMDKLGPDATVGELLGATKRSEKLLVVAAMSASIYVGALIGSLAVAAGRSLAGGTSLADALAMALGDGTYRPWLVSTLIKHPGILDKRVKSRHLLAAFARR